MLKFLIRLALCALVLAMALPAIGMATFTGGIWAGLGIGALCTFLAAVGSFVASLGGIALFKTVGMRRGLMYGFNYGASFVVNLIALGVTALILSQFFALSGVLAALLGAVLLTVICACTEGMPLKLTVTYTVTRTTTTSFGRSRTRLGR